MSKVFEGKSICGGLAVGRIYLWHKEIPTVDSEKIVDTDAEIALYEEACNVASVEVYELYEKALREFGAEKAGIFEAQGMILVDEEYNAFVRYEISANAVSAQHAVKTTCEHFVAMFLNMEDEYFRARSEDVKDVSDRLLGILCRLKEGSEKNDEKSYKGISEPYIVAAEEMTPSEVLQLDKAYLQGLVVGQGSAGSHLAILAQTLNIPVLAGIDISAMVEGELGIVDGLEGRFFLKPEKDILEKIRHQILQEREQKNTLLKYKGCRTRLSICANIGDLSDLRGVQENDGEGIGLFRSEMMYMKGEAFPSEEALFGVYRRILEEMEGKRVVLRTLDLGADKCAEYMGIKREENPGLGSRGIRLCFEWEDVFRTQLRAMLRAGVYGNLAIMYPMITSLWEVRKIKKMVEDVKAELQKEGIPYRLEEQGIMIETPAAAIISDLLAKEVDFFSIGTNDLTQYTLAADRQAPEMESYYDAGHEAVLRLIRLTVENGHKAGIRVGICGEIAADISMTEKFVDWGVDELSVAPGKVLLLRKTVMELTDSYK